MIKNPTKVSFAPANPGDISHRWLKSLDSIDRHTYAVAAEIALQAVFKGCRDVRDIQRMPLFTPSVVEPRYKELNLDILQAVDEARLPEDTRGQIATGVAALTLLHGASAAVRAPRGIITLRDSRFTLTGNNTQISTKETDRGRAVGKAMELGPGESVDTLTVRAHKDMEYDTIQCSAQTASGVGHFVELDVIPSHLTRDGNHNILMAAGTVYLGIPDMPAVTRPEALECAGRGLMVAAHPL